MNQSHSLVSTNPVGNTAGSSITPPTQGGIVNPRPKPTQPNNSSKPTKGRPVRKPKNKESRRYMKRAARWQVHKTKTRANRSTKRKIDRQLKEYIKLQGLDPNEMFEEAVAKAEAEMAAQARAQAQVKENDEK
ncbi:hypothetical protein BDV93DRAFT_521458 [Ceratobasidium sp. AG-I]|nr:hypothetical protein BDV93DRAFT_521458 [Ceratobasidium sp. AG-I]